MASQLGKPFTPSLHTRSRDFNLSHSVCRPFHDTAPLSACQGSSGALGAQLICFQVRAALTQAARQGRGPEVRDDAAQVRRPVGQRIAVLRRERAAVVRVQVRLVAELEVDDLRPAAPPSARAAP